uniref:Uncharacterized protein n=1 Tax=Sipha flava TaxID=143950 RepID=A0A2S2Q4T0_9HEMI
MFSFGRHCLHLGQIVITIFDMHTIIIDNNTTMICINYGVQNGAARIPALEAAAECVDRLTGRKKMKKKKKKTVVRTLRIPTANGHADLVAFSVMFVQNPEVEERNPARLISCTTSARTADIIHNARGADRFHDSFKRERNRNTTIVHEL